MNKILTITKEGDIKTFKKLTKSVDVNLVIENHKNLLLIAFSNGNLELSEVIIKNGINTSFEDEDGKNILHYFPYYFKQLKSKYSEKEIIRILKLILENSTVETINKQDRIYGNTPLLNSVILFYSYQIVEEFLKNDARTDIPNYSNINFVEFVRNRNNKILLQMLKKYKII